MSGRSILADGNEPMMTLRRTGERHHVLRRRQEAWHSFNPEDHTDPLATGFGALELLDELRVPPGAGLAPHPRQDAEIITYVRDGALAYEDSMGYSGVIQAGEFQCMTAGRRMRHGGSNASRTDWAHVFQIWLRPSAPELGPGREQKRFSVAERRDGLCVVASPDARGGSLRIHQDALVHSALLDVGKHVVHELVSGRSAWLHVVHGEVTLGNVVLSTGDGAGVTAERAVSITAREGSEILLFDVGAPLSRSNGSGS